MCFWEVEVESERYLLVGHHGVWLLLIFGIRVDFVGRGGGGGGGGPPSGSFQRSQHHYSAGW